MPPYTIIEQLPDAADYNRLRQIVGWGACPVEVAEPAHQGRGIGGQLMDRVMAYLRAHAVQGAVVGLMAAAGKEGFYERYGFVRRPTERLGAGMTLFWRME